jgi:uncharacterized lipoprotein YddW (UPF0748 family)
MRLLVHVPIAAVALLTLAACGPAPAPRLDPVHAPPALQREFRGVWIASVANIDWPSSPGLPASQQQAELLAMFDRAVELNLNAIIFQIRPMADALYESPYEPWSEYLTGTMGSPPDVAYDPLEFAIAEAHRRGLELHAWFNPYRARHPSARSEISADHISQTRSDIVREYGRHLWMDPGEPDVQDQTVRVILDVVRRYDVDGIHIDDYFYPYRERDAAGELIDFPDDPSYTRYASQRGTLSRDDWRRDNVDRLVERLHREIRAEKPWVRFGISPFGIWRPGYPSQIQGFDAYDQIYADARKWIVSGWMDYWTPQLYWPIAQTPQSFPVLLNWWVEQNQHGRHIWPGAIPNRVADTSQQPWLPSEVVGQIHVTRGHPGASGLVHFSMRSLMRDDSGLVEALKAGPYATQALPPATTWLPAPPVGEPRVSLRPLTDGGAEVGLEMPGSERPAWWVVRARHDSGWETQIIPGWQTSHSITERMPIEIAVSAVDRLGNEGPLIVVRGNR